jgi:hypothetical protein
MDWAAAAGGKQMMKYKAFLSPEFAPGFFS